MNNTPSPFAALSGQPLATQLLTRSLQCGQIATTYLFEGIAGIGKATAARLFAAQLLECSLDELGYHPDFISLRAETGTLIRVQPIRDLVAQVSTYPLQAARRVVIVEGAQGMNTAAGNAFLKTLEDSQLTTFILLCDQTLRLATIRSRGQSIPFYPLAPAELKTVLSQVAPTLLDYPELLQSAEGSPGTAIANGRQAAGCASVKEGLQSLAELEDLSELSLQVSQLPDETQQWLLRFVGWSGWQHPSVLDALDQAQRQLKQRCYALNVWEQLLDQLARTLLTLRLEAPPFETVPLDNVEDEGEPESAIEPVATPQPQPAPVQKSQMSLFGYRPD